MFARINIIGIEFPDKKTLVAKKATDQPITENERDFLVDVYNEAVNRLKQSRNCLFALSQYIQNDLKENKKKNKSYGECVNFKEKLLADPAVTNELRTTLKMLKRHFFVNVSSITHEKLILKIDKIIMALLQSYHGLIEKPVLSNLSKEKQKSHTRGYVDYLCLFESSRQSNNIHVGDIHIDFRSVTDNPIMAVKTLIHEALHRYACINDQSEEGYYHSRKALKQTDKDKETNCTYFRPAPNINKSKKAFDNADSFAFFCIDMTGCWFHDKQELPPWWDFSIIQKRNGIVPYFASVKNVDMEETLESYYDDYLLLPGNNNVGIILNNSSKKVCIIFKNDESEENASVSVIYLDEKEFKELGLGDFPNNSQELMPALIHQKFNIALSKLILENNGSHLYKEEYAIADNYQHDRSELWLFMAKSRF